MEDFLVLSILDLQLDATKHRLIDKSKVMAYIMLGDVCVDCLILGSPSATIQDKVKAAASRPKPQVDSGGAAPHNFN